MSEPATPVSRLAGSLINPFPGLRAFEPDEDYLYFGRERQIDELLHRLGDTRLLAVVGTSGSGKSSLVRAGLVPALYSGFMTRAGSSWRVAILRPGGDPIGNLAAALDDPAVLGQGEELGEAGRMILDSTLRASSLGLVDCVRQSRIPAADNVLVVVDQFEELFRFKQSARASRDEAVAFVKLLLAAASSGERLYVVLTMRSEFIGDCMEFPGLPEAINSGQYLVPRMTRDELRLAITGPVAVRGGEISPRLVARLLNDVEDDQDQLPLLQHALMRMWGLWERREDDSEILDLGHYEAIGTLSEALSQHAESAFRQLAEERDRKIAERMFKALTDTDREGRGVRRPVSIGEICALTGADEAAVVEVVETFRARGRSFLMPPPVVSLGRDSVVDLAHESLMRNWARLKDWAREEAESAEIYRRLSKAAALARAGEGSLWRSPELDIGLRWRETERPTAAWARRYDPAFEQAMAFLDKSRAKRTHHRLAKLAAGPLAVAALALAAVLVGYLNSSYRKEMRAQWQARLESVLSASDPLVQALLLAEIPEPENFERGLKVAQEVARAAIPKAVLRGREGSLIGVAFDADSKQVVTVSVQGAVNWWPSDGRGDPRSDEPIRAPSSGESPPELTAVAFSDDGRTLAAGFADGTLLLRSLDPEAGDEDQLVRSGQGRAILSLAFSPDGQRIAVGYENYTVWIWSPAGGWRLVGTHQGPVAGVAFSADGERLVTNSWDGTARIWDLRARDAPLVVPPPGEGLEEVQNEDRGPVLQSAAFSPDGRWVICGSGDGTLRIWSADGSGEPIELAGQGKSAKHASFSPDGLKAIASYDDRTARVWRLRLDEDGRLEAAGAPTTLEGHAGPLSGAVFSHSGSEIATISDDGTARIWPAETGEPQILGWHAEGVESVAFSADGTRLVSASRDGTARVWFLDGSAEPLVLAGHKEWVRSAAFNPAGTRVLTASEDGTWRLWDLAGNEVSMVPEESGVLGAAFDPAGDRVVTATRQPPIAHIWELDAAGEAIPVEELVHENWVWSAAFSDDGGRVVTASRDHTARVWRLDRAGGAASVLETLDHGDQVWSAEFGPDGSRVVTASEDGAARIWTLNGSAEAIVLRHGYGVNEAAFSADGGRVVTASDDGTARVWSAAGGLERVVLSHGSPVLSAAFQPVTASGGEVPAYVATGSDDGAVRIWRVSVEALTAYAKNATTACLTEGQRTRFLAESWAQARREAEECERSFERMPPPAGAPPGATR